MKELHGRLEQVVLRLPQITARSEEMMAQAEHYSGLSEDAVHEMAEIKRSIALNSENLHRIDTLGQSLGRMSGELMESVKVFQVKAA